MSNTNDKDKKKRVKDSKLKGLTKGRPLFTMRTDDDFEANLEKAKEKSGLKNESEVVRFLLNQYVNQ